MVAQPPSVANSGTNTWCLHSVWNALPGSGKGDREVDEDGGRWEVLQTADFPFKIPVPEGLPPTARLDKQCGISYELVASLCVKGKKGLLKKESTSSIIQSVHPIVIEKHDLHSTWPAYNVPDEHHGENEGVRCRVERYQTCYAPGDKVRVKIIVQSGKIEPAKLKSVAFSVRETITFHGGKSSRLSLTSNSATNRNKPASQRTETLTQKAKQVGKKLYKGDSYEYELECAIPKHHALMTISTAKHVEVSYTMRVYVDVSKAPIIIDHLPMTMTTFTRTASWETTRKIGYVPGLSSDDTASSVSGGQSRGMTRSQSYSGSAASLDRRGIGGGPASYDFNSNLRRRDTVMTQATNFSGPGMAGRGVPGQLFSYSYGSYGAVQPYQDEAAPVPRPAFAGPQGGVDGLELSPEEQVAMFHHSNRPQDAYALGGEYRILNNSGIVPLDGGRPHFQAIQEEGAPMSTVDVHQQVVQQHIQQHHHHPRFHQALGTQPPPGNASPASVSSPVMMSGSPSLSANSAAEEEKIRLYNRAREQAEKNQRRADQQRQLAQASSIPPSMSHPGHGQSINRLSNGEIRVKTPTRQSTQRLSVVGGSSQPLGSTLMGSEEEKKRLWERARREAEDYQKKFTQGVSFPPEESSSNPASGPPTANSSASALQATSGSTLHAPVANRRRSSGMYWLDSPTVDPNEARGLHALSAPSDQPSVSAPATGTPTPQPIAPFPTAAEEKQRLYNEAKAQTEAHTRVTSGQQAPMSSSQAASSSQTPPSAAQPPPFARQTSSTEPPAVPGGFPANTLDEKAQQARFYAAQDAVARHQAEQSSSSLNNASAGSSNPAAAALPSYAQPPQSSSAMSNGAGSSSVAPPVAAEKRVASGPALSEKEQMRLYYEARERQAESERAAQHTPAPQQVQPARPPAHVNHGSSASLSGPGPSSSMNALVAPAPPPRPVGSFDTQTSTPPTLPALSFSSGPASGNFLSSPTSPPNASGSTWHIGRGATPTPIDGPWAPKIATSWSIADDEKEGAGPSGSRATSGAPAPPPLPPKTLASPSRG